MAVYDICYVYPRKLVSFRYVAQANRDAGFTVKEYSEEEFGWEKGVEEAAKLYAKVSP